LNTAERDLVIKVFNDKQDMLDKTSEVFGTLIATINAPRAAEDKISAPQLAGYWSSLCRWADYSAVRREQWIERSLKKGVYTLRPVYSEKFVARIQENSRKRKAEYEQRKKDHAEIKRTGVRKKVIIPSPQPKAVEELDLADII